MAWSECYPWMNQRLVNVTYRSSGWPENRWRNEQIFYDDTFILIFSTRSGKLPVRIRLRNLILSWSKRRTGGEIMRKYSIHGLIKIYLKTVASDRIQLAINPNHHTPSCHCPIATLHWTQQSSSLRCRLLSKWRFSQRTISAAVCIHRGLSVHLGRFRILAYLIPRNLLVPRKVERGKKLTVKIVHWTFLCLSRWGRNKQTRIPREPTFLWEFFWIW